MSIVVTNVSFPPNTSGASGDNSMQGGTVAAIIMAIVVVVGLGATAMAYYQNYARQVEYEHALQERYRHGAAVEMMGLHAAEGSKLNPLAQEDRHEHLL
jgi:Tfp pilus assembly major pilin PilA